MSDAMKTTRPNLIKVPWLQDPNTVAFNEALGDEQDRIIDRARSAVKMRWGTAAGMQAVAASVGAALDTAEGDPARLAHLGATFDLPRLGSMSDAQYDAYLESTWTVHGQGGTVAGIEGALNAYGIPDVEVVEEWQDMAGTWATPGIYGKRICIILGPNYGTLGWAPMGFPFVFPTPQNQSPTAILNATKTYEFVLGINRMTQGQLQDIARLIRRWKDAGAMPVKLVFRFQWTPGGPASPVFDSSGLTFPIPLTTAPDAVTFYMTGTYFNQADNGYDLSEGLAFPIAFGPTYTLYGT